MDYIGRLWQSVYMKFRFKMFRLHLAASATVLTLVLGGLYLGWYHWPGWYLAVVTRVVVVMVGVDLALVYGSVQLWKGRPLYYVFSGGILQLVQAYDIDPQEVQLARDKNADFAPHWYSLPRWVWSPEPAQADRPAVAANAARPDYSTMPRYYRPWEAGSAPPFRSRAGAGPCRSCSILRR